MDKIIVTKEYLLENMNRTFKDIANELGCSSTTVYNLYRKHNIIKLDTRFKGVKK